MGRKNNRRHGKGCTGRNHHRPKHRSRRSHRHKGYYCNEHHLLFPKADWGRSIYGSKLRNHKYFKRIVPEDTLHHSIHHCIINIPVPPDGVCRETYYEILRREKAHAIDPYKDTLEARLQLLIDLWKDYPRTVAALKKQREIIMNFYNNGRT